MKKSLKYKIVIFIMIVLLAGLVGLNILIISNKINLNVPELSTKGFVKVSISTSENKVALSANCYSAFGTVSDDQVHSIENAMFKTKDLRPLSHDTTQNILESYGIQIIMVKVTELRDNNFIGQLFLKSGNKITSIDVRPSDGIAIALRNNAPIYMNETLLKEQGMNIC